MPLESEQKEILRREIRAIYKFIDHNCQARNQNPQESLDNIWSHLSLAPNGDFAKINDPHAIIILARQRLYDECLKRSYHLANREIFDEAMRRMNELSKLYQRQEEFGQIQIKDELAAIKTMLQTALSENNNLRRDHEKIVSILKNDTARRFDIPSSVDLKPIEDRLHAIESSVNAIRDELQDAPPQISTHERLDSITLHLADLERAIIKLNYATESTGTQPRSGHIFSRK